MSSAPAISPSALVSQCNLKTLQQATKLLYPNSVPRLNPTNWTKKIWKLIVLVYQVYGRSPQKDINLPSQVQEKITEHQINFSSKRTF